MATNIEFREFGKDNAMVIPTWGFLAKPDKNLRGYYDAVLNQPFNKKGFRRAGVFRNVGRVTNGNFSNFNNIKCLDMPIRMAGSREWKIPFAFAQFIPAISTIISFEAAHNKSLIDFNAYLTIDQSETKAGDTHRHSGLHVDGFQGARINPKVACDRSYIVADTDCPSFWNQSFETVESMDDATQNIFHEFDRTAHYSSEIKCEPYQIYFMDSYAVHSANAAKSPRRTFCRLSFSVRQYDRLGNSHNHLFDYKWNMVKRDIETALKKT
jgi:hypothetical protein